MSQLRNATKSLLDKGYREDRAIAQQLGEVDITPEQYGKLKDSGTPLAEKFSKSMLLANYKETGVYNLNEDDDAINDRIKTDVRNHLEMHAEMHVH